MISSEDILKGCINGNRSCQEMLYKEYAPKMFAVCRSYAQNNDAAKDILQNGFIKVFKKIDQYNHEGEIGAWIRRIIVNTALDYCRKVEREQQVGLEIINENQFSINDTSDNLNLTDLVNVIRTLPEKARIIFNLYVIEGYSHKEIALLLNITEGTSKSQFSRAKKLLQERIPNQFDS